MATGTLAENLAKIRGTAVAGSEVREAIASAIELSDAEVDARVDVVRDQVLSRNLYLTTSAIENDDYLLTITNAT